MQAKRIVWAMLAVSIYLGLLTNDAGPLTPDVGVVGTSAAIDECIRVDPSGGGVSVDPNQCVTSPAYR